MVGRVDQYLVHMAFVQILDFSLICTLYLLDSYQYVCTCLIWNLVRCIKLDGRIGKMGVHLIKWAHIDFCKRPEYKSDEISKEQSEFIKV
ncbi:hypothetical protein SUGI_1038070 [Cryptomeria japonica]|nr:hypothetical protein SUGI_1038070 [Cryptomeria japonica]